MVTVKRDLRTGTSVWSVERVPPVPHAKLTTDLTTEVLVVGAGISGAFMAEALSERHRVTIIDRRGVAKGSTAASTALITSELDVPLTQLARKIGKANAVRAWRRAAIALQAIEARSAFLGLADDGRLVRRGSLYLAGDRLGPDELAGEGAARRA